MSLLLAAGAGGPTNYADTLSAGSYSISGKTLSDSVVRADSLSAGSYAISGKTLTDVLAKSDSLTAGAYAISGKSLTDSVVRADNLTAGAYAISGKNITDTVSRADNLSAGAYVISGKDITDVVTTTGTAYADDLSAGAYLIVGNDLTDDYSPASNTIIYWPGGWSWPSTRNKEFYEKQISEELKQEIASIEPKAAEIIVNAVEDKKPDQEREMRLEMDRLGIVYRQYFQEIYTQLLVEKQQQEDDAQIALIIAALI